MIGSTEYPVRIESGDLPKENRSFEVCGWLSTFSMDTSILSSWSSAKSSSMRVCKHRFHMPQILSSGLGAIRLICNS